LDHLASPKNILGLSVSNTWGQVPLDAAGASQDHLQMIRIYIVNFRPGEDANLVARCLSEVFGNEDPPASSWIGVVGLAQPEYLVEADAVAVIPQ
jgi:enamine deaminase RidA (YjgF/YER057c/UK114 family)